MLANLIRHFFPGYKTKKELKEEINLLEKRNLALVAKSGHFVVIKERKGNKESFNDNNALRDCRRSLFMELDHLIDYKFLDIPESHERCVRGSITVVDNNFYDFFRNL